MTHLQEFKMYVLVNLLRKTQIKLCWSLSVTIFMEYFLIGFPKQFLNN